MPGVASTLAQAALQQGVCSGPLMITTNYISILIYTNMPGVASILAQAAVQQGVYSGLLIITTNYIRILIYTNMPGVASTLAQAALQQGVYSGPPVHEILAAASISAAGRMSAARAQRQYLYFCTSKASKLSE